MWYGNHQVKAKHFNMHLSTNKTYENLKLKTTMATSWVVCSHICWITELILKQFSILFNNDKLNVSYHYFTNSVWFSVFQQTNVNLNTFGLFFLPKKNSQNRNAQFHSNAQKYNHSNFWSSLNTSLVITSSQYFGKKIPNSPSFNVFADVGKNFFSPSQFAYPI